jgi:hypothetical protein
LDANPDHGDNVFPGLKVVVVLKVGNCVSFTFGSFLGSTIGKYAYLDITGLTFI